MNCTGAISLGKALQYTERNRDIGSNGILKKLEAGERGIQQLENKFQEGVGHLERTGTALEVAVDISGSSNRMPDQPAYHNRDWSVARTPPSMDFGM